MRENFQYEKIKRQKGETFARLIRDFDDGIFFVPNLSHILKYAGSDVQPLLRFLRTLKKEKNDIVTNEENPFVLLYKAGYDAFYADTPVLQDSIKKYFKKEELLCTFGTKRYENYYIIHAIKRGADKLNRDDFNGKEAREDEYGTSVISIQILKSGGFISIKNRYNHTVLGCDNTFNSNPDEIIPGLSHALKKHFDVDFNVGNVDIPGQYKFHAGQIIKYHQEIMNIYFGDGFYLMDGRVIEINKNEEIMIDDVVLNLRKKTVFSPLFHSPLKKVIEREIENKQLSIRRVGDRLKLYADNQELIEIFESKLTKICLKASTLPAKSFYKHPFVEEVFAPNLKDMERCCFCECKSLKFIHLPVLEKTNFENCFSKINAKINAPTLLKKGIVFLGSVMISVSEKQVLNEGQFSICFKEYLNQLISKKLEGVFQNGFETKLLFKNGDYLLFENDELTKICLNQEEEIPPHVIQGFSNLKQIELSNLKVMKNDNICSLPDLKTLILPELVEMSFNCVKNCPSLEKFHAPKLYETSSRCLSYLPLLKEVYLPLLTHVGECNFTFTGLEKVSLPNLTRIKNNSFQNNPLLQKIEMPELSWSQEKCFLLLPRLEEISLPKLYYIWGEGYLSKNKSLKKVVLPNLRCVRPYFLDDCPMLKEVYLENATTFNDNVLSNHPNLEHLFAPNLEIMDDRCLSNCPKLGAVSFPKLYKVGDYVCVGNHGLKNVYAPDLIEVGFKSFQKDMNMPKGIHHQSKWAFINPTYQREKE